MTKKIVVTGASGFIGKHLCRHLHALGHKVLPLSRQPTTGMHTISNYTECPTADLLIHLAENPLRKIVNNYAERDYEKATFLCGFLSNKFKNRMIYASSSTVYGDQNTTPNTEQTPCFASDTYTKLKLYNEQVVLNNSGTVVRLANIFGSGMSADTVISQIIEQSHPSNKLYVGNCSAIRDFLAIQDLVSAFEYMVNDPKQGLYNIASGEIFSIRKIAQKILLFCHQNTREIIETHPSNLTSTIEISIEKLTSAFKWKPLCSVDQRLKDYIESLGEHMNAQA